MSVTDLKIVLINPIMLIRTTMGFVAFVLDRILKNKIKYTDFRCNASWLPVVLSGAVDEQLQLVQLVSVQMRDQSWGPAVTRSWRVSRVIMVPRSVVDNCIPR